MLRQVKQFTTALFRNRIGNGYNTWTSEKWTIGFRILHRPFSLHRSVGSRIETVKQRHLDITKELSGSNLSSKKITDLSIELGELDPIVNKIAELEEINNEVKALEEIIDEFVGENASPDDIELRNIAIKERSEYIQQVKLLETDLTRLLLPKDAADDKSAIIEIRPGTGGDEATLFAMDMLRMYQKHALLKCWECEILSITTTDIGGCKEGVLLLKGRGVFGRMKYESGVHRVQRVPVNDSRVHTSAMSVAVLPEMEDIEVKLDPSDLKIDVYRASGAGGQHVNTTESAVRITHLPTGIVVAIQDERSQHKNKAKAMKILVARVYDAEQRKLQQQRSSLRNQQIGSGDRSERIRTYNFPQNRISDHRINYSIHGMEQMLQGEMLDELVDHLQIANQNLLLDSFNETNP